MPEPVPLPEWPGIGEDLRLTPAQADKLLDFAEAADANTEIARELSAALEGMVESRNALIDMGEAEHELAELRRQLLEEERSARRWDRLLWWGGVGLFGVIGAFN